MACHPGGLGEGFSPVVFAVGGVGGGLARGRGFGCGPGESLKGGGNDEREWNYVLGGVTPAEVDEAILVGVGSQVGCPRVGGVTVSVVGFQVKGSHMTDIEAVVVGGQWAGDHYIGYVEISEEVCQGVESRGHVHGMS